jgi:hypothetical protein
MGIAAPIFSAFRHFYSTQWASVSPVSLADTAGFANWLVPSVRFYPTKCQTAASYAPPSCLNITNRSQACTIAALAVVKFRASPSSAGVKNSDKPVTDRPVVRIGSCASQWQPQRCRHPPPGQCDRGGALEIIFDRPIRTASTPHCSPFCP